MTSGDPVTSLVACGVVAQLVGEPIDLNRQRSCHAEKIEREWIMRPLAAETEAVGSGP